MINEKELNINHVVDIVMTEHKVRLFIEHFNLKPPYWIKINSFGSIGDYSRPRVDCCCQASCNDVIET